VLTDESKSGEEKNSDGEQDEEKSIFILSESKVSLLVREEKHASEVGGVEGEKVCFRKEWLEQL